MKRRCIHPHRMLCAAALAILLATYGVAPSLAQGPPKNATTDAASAKKTAAERPPEGVWEIMFSGGIIGNSIMISIFALSLTAAFLVFEQFQHLRAKVLLPQGLAEDVRRFVATGRISEALDACGQRPSMLAAMLDQGLSEIESGWPAVEKALEDAAAEQSAKLFRRVEYLSVIANLAPMLGLLGTVVGMVMCFQEVANSQGAAGTAKLARGIYTALNTTVAGLVVAIPALGAFALLRNKVDQLVAEGAYAALHAFAPLKRANLVRPPPPPQQPLLPPGGAGVPRQ